MAYPLAVISPLLGARSETFIRRHMADVLPGRTVVVADHRRPPDAGHWSVDAPTLLLDETDSRGRMAILNVSHTLTAWRAVKRPIRILSRRLRGLPPEPHPRRGEARRFLRDHGVRAILSQYLCFSLEWLSVARELDIPFFAHAHGFDVSLRLREPGYRQQYLQYNQTAGVIVMSQVIARRLAGIGIHQQKIHVVPYGVDVPEDQPPHDHTVRPVRCVAVGRMVAKKAPLETLEAFRLASQQYPELTLDFVGTGPLFEPAQEFVADHNLADRVRLHGGQPSAFIQALMRQAHIFLQHSVVDRATGDEEGLPVAILEAMASALPVVSTRHAGIPEAVQEGATGNLVYEHDVQGMARRIIDLAADPGRRQQFGLNAWRRCRDQFSWLREKENLLRILNLH